MSDLMDFLYVVRHCFCLVFEYFLPMKLDSYFFLFQYQHVEVLVACYLIDCSLLLVTSSIARERVLSSDEKEMYVIRFWARDPILSLWSSTAFSSLKLIVLLML